MIASIRFLFLAFALLAVNAVRGAETTAPASAPSPSADYELAERDLVEIQVFNQPEMTTRQRVSSSGELRLPLLGTVPVAGKTLRLVEHELEEHLRDKGFFVQPQVILSIMEYGSRFVSVLGEVKEPVRIPLPPEATTLGIVQAITEAGGFTRVARRDQVQVIRPGPVGEQRIIVDLDQALDARRGSAPADFALRPGDIVFVPERVF